FECGQLAYERAQQSRLARPVGPDHRDALTSTDRDLLRESNQRLIGVSSDKLPHLEDNVSGSSCFLELEADRAFFARALYSLQPIQSFLSPARLARPLTGAIAADVVLRLRDVSLLRLIFLP